MVKLGIIGWRGMVGSVLVNRLKAEGDDKKYRIHLFSSTSGLTAEGIDLECDREILHSYSIDNLTDMDVLISCQGGDYTKEIHPQLRKKGWNGYWIDAASALRLEPNATIVLDPLNSKQIVNSLNDGIKDFVGGNCTVSLLLMAIAGLVKEDMIDWISTMTYQAASGAGANAIIELIKQNHYLTKESKLFQEKRVNALNLERELTSLTNSATFPRENFGHSLAMNLLPFIDTQLENGQSREEFKAFAEANKILGRSEQKIPIDGTCVRVGALRCHSQGLTIKLKKSADISTIESLIQNANEWVDFIPNNREDSLAKLTPLNYTGNLKIGVGRVRKMNLGEDYLNLFTVGDQLLWGAAEPLRRFLRFL